MEGVIVVVLFVLMLLTVTRSVHVVPQGEEWVVERLGKYLKVLNCGLNILVPHIDRVAYRVMTKETVLDVPEQEIMTRGNAVIMVKAMAYIKVIDPVKAVYGVANFTEAIRHLMTMTLSSIIGEMEPDEVLSSRDSIKARLHERVSGEALNWGINIRMVDIQDLRISEERKA